MYHFVLKKAHWGIDIRLDIEGALRSYPPKDADMTFENRIFLFLHEQWLSHREKECVSRAFKAAALRLQPPHKLLRVDLKGLHFNPRGYQEEGLTLALLNWLADSFQVTLPRVNVRYQQGLGRYILEFAGG